LTIGAQKATSVARDSRNFSGLESGVGSAGVDQQLLEMRFGARRRKLGRGHEPRGAEADVLVHGGRRHPGIGPIVLP
jgi:hypothetical protein